MIAGNNQPQEMQALSEDLYSVDELEERLELASTALLDALCAGNVCGSNSCGGNEDGGWW